MKRCYTPIVLTLVLAASCSSSLWANDLPPVPPSLVDSLTVPVGSVRLKKMYFKYKSPELRSSDRDYLTRAFERLRDFKIYLVIKAFVGKKTAEDKTVELASERVDYLKATVSEATGWPESRFVSMVSEIRQRKKRRKKIRQRIEISLAVPKENEQDLDQLREDIAATGIDLSDYNSQSQKIEPTTKSLEKIAPKKKDERTFYGLFGITFGGGSQTREDMAFSRNTIYLGARYVISEQIHLQGEYQSFTATFKKNGSYFVQGDTLILSVFTVHRLNRFAAMTHGFGALYSMQKLKNYEGDSARIGEDIFEKPSFGFQYNGQFEFDPPRFDVKPFVGLTAQIIQDSIFAGPTFGIKF